MSKYDSEKVVKDIRRNTRRKYSAEEKIRVVLDGLRALVNVLINGTYPAGNTTLERFRSIGHSP